MIEDRRLSLELLDGPSPLNVHPKEFVPPHGEEAPQYLFPPTRINPHLGDPRRGHRLVHRDDDKCMLIYTDGVSLDDEAEPLAGCSFVFKDNAQTAQNLGEHRGADTNYRNYCCFSLEKEGPTGELHTRDADRAKLRAIIGALQFRVWAAEGFKKVVIATDSAHLVQCITTRVHAWAQENWFTSRGEMVKDYDLWMLLIEGLENALHPDADEEKLEVEFWHIPAVWNREAWSLAKFAAEENEVQTVFTPIIGLNV
ncbi:ribonuclease H-like protein [Penicillium herquei]|nr:ribonuclease H-like protein [Penicillium herquei]